MHVSVVGSGYVGTTVAACLADLGHDVVSVHIDQDVVDAINDGHAPLHEPGVDERIQRTIGDRLRATTSYDTLPETDLTILAIGTPSNPDGSIDSDVDDGKDEDYFEQARENVRQLKEEYDVEMDVEASMEVDSWNAQQVALYVREELGEDAFLRLHERLFDAHWQDGLDIGDPDVLRDLVAEIGRAHV